MLMVLQFPIADGRLFTPASELRLPLPEWPAPTTGVNSQFVRSFGPAVRRLRGGDAAWADEGTFCAASRAIRFPKLREQRLGASRQMAPVCAFRRVFSDGKTVVRVEIGLALSRNRQPTPPLAQVLRAVQDAIEIPTHVGPSAPPAKAKPLITQARQLAALYSRATSRHGKGASSSIPEGPVEAGSPVLLIETRDSGGESPPRSVRIIDAGCWAPISPLPGFSRNGVRWGPGCLVRVQQVQPSFVAFVFVFCGFTQNRRRSIEF